LSRSVRPRHELGKCRAHHATCACAAVSTLSTGPLARKPAFATLPASLAGDLGVPARDAQTILGHTRISTTLEIYTDTDDEARRDALTRLQSLLGDTQN